MLRFGQAIKLTKPVKRRVSKQTAKAWKSICEIAPYKKDTSFSSSWRVKWIENQCYLIFPPGTLGVLYRIYIDQAMEWCGLKFEHPKRKTPSKFTVGTTFDHVTLDLTLVERDKVSELQKQLILNKKEGDNFDKVSALKKILEKP